MKRFLSWGVGACLFLAMGSCQLDQQDEETLRMEIAKDFTLSAPADVAILPVDSATGMDDAALKALRHEVYQIFLDKDYAPGGLDYVDDVVRSRGLGGIRLSTRLAWNTAPFQGIFFYDGIVMISVDRFRESEGAGSGRIEIQGKIALLSSKNMALLYEKSHAASLRQKPGESRGDFLNRVVEQFAEEIVAPLPRKPVREDPEKIL